MRAVIALALMLVAAPAVAETKPAAKPAAKVAAKPVCKRVVQGRGLERKVVWQCDAPVVVSSSPAKPKVVYITRGGRSVTGRPKSADRLDGLSRRLGN